MTTLDPPIADVGSAVPTGSAGLRGLLKRPLALSAVIVLLIIAISCALAQVIAPLGPLEQDLAHVLAPPSAAHLLGTDTLGRDVLSRILWGGQPALLGALEAAAVFAVLGVLFGLVAGYTDGAVDRAISLLVDLQMSLPGLVLMFAVLALFNNDLAAAMVTLGAFSSGGLVRVVRAATKATREELYVSAARVAGLSNPRILARHVAPRLTGPIVIQVALFAGIALVVQSGLGFLNLGVVAPSPTWGGMVGEASQVIAQSPWLLVPSGGIIGISILCFGIIGDAVRDINAEIKAPLNARRRQRMQPRPGSSPALDPTRLLDVSGLRIEFDGRAGGTEVVHGIDFSVDAGELVGLVGESGSGKTITGLSLLGLLPSSAKVSATTMAFRGVNITRATPSVFRELRGKGIGLVSQEPMVALDPVFTVGDQLSEAIRAHGGFSRTAARARALQLLADVRLPDPEAVAGRYAFELSGGMAQRVVIAMALAGDPALLLADEPTTALDVTVQAEILDLLRNLRDERGMAIILVTHDLGVVADFCERVLVMQHGVIVEQNDVDTVFERPAHPYTRSLIEATPSLVDLHNASRGPARER